MKYYDIPDDKYKNEILFFLNYHPNSNNIAYRIKVQIPVYEVPEIGSYLGGYYGSHFNLYTVIYQYGRINFNVDDFTLGLGTVGILHPEEANIRTADDFRYYSGGNNSIKLFSANDKIYKKKAKFLVESKKHLLNNLAKEVTRN